MKIEKLTDNKIRIILKQSELSIDKLQNEESIFSTPEFKKIFLIALDRAEKEVNFNAAGCKLLIELLSKNEENYIFIVTKYLEMNKQNSYKKIHKKNFQKNIKPSTRLYVFNQFNDFDQFIEYANNKHLEKIFKIFRLYIYNNSYYLVIKRKRNTTNSFEKLNIILLEFAEPLEYSKEFEAKLNEHGKLILKLN